MGSGSNSSTPNRNGAWSGWCEPNRLWSSGHTTSSRGR